MSSAQFSQQLSRLLYRNIEDDNDIAEAYKLIMSAYRSGAEGALTYEQLSYIIMTAAQLVFPEAEDRLNIRKIMLTAFRQGQKNRPHQGEPMRGKLIPYSGQPITVTACYMYEDERGDRGHLVRMVKDIDGEHLCDHLWIKAVFQDTIERGDDVTLRGVVQKYASFSRKDFGHENYGLFEVEVIANSTDLKDVS